MLKDPSVVSTKPVVALPIIAGVVLLAVTAIAVALTQTAKETSGDFTISQVSDNAFGDLAFSAAGLESRSADTATLSTGSGGGMPSPADTSVIAPALSYSFTYTGAAFDLSEAKRLVYRRPELTGPKLGTLLDGSMNPFGTNAFGGATIQSLSLSNGDDDYRAYIDYDSGYLSISLENGGSEASNSSELSDEEILAIANDFLDTFGISRAGYGEPEITSFGVTSGSVSVSAVAEDTAERIAKPEIYLPDHSVVYPMMIQGMYVYEPSGSKVGLTVSVSSSTRKVSYLTQRLGSQLESSLYDSETDFEKIRTLVSEGGLQKYYYGSGTPTASIEVGAPVLGFVQTQRYDGGFSGEELYAPALIFPLTKDDADKVYLKNLVIPLVQGVGNDSIRIMDGGSIEPMPAVDLPTR